jgi:hypothetical protein
MVEFGWYLIALQNILIILNDLFELLALKTRLIQLLVGSHARLV